MRQSISFANRHPLIGEIQPNKAFPTRNTTGNSYSYHAAKKRIRLNSGLERKTEKGVENVIQ